MGNKYPMLSFALPVYNGGAALDRCLKSLVEQDFDDFEIVIVDNASTDDTPDICEKYSKICPKIRYFRNPNNIGQNPNVNRALLLCRGSYLRFIGHDDWLEPNYASTVVKAFDENPDVIGVSTEYDLTTDSGERMYNKYEGKRLEGSTPGRRFARMLRFYCMPPEIYDPCYCAIKRQAWDRTHQIQVRPDMDQVYTLELALLGRFHHVPKLLAHRRWAPPMCEKSKKDLLEWYNPGEAHKLEATVWGRTQNFRKVLSEMPVRIGPIDQIRCEIGLLRFYVHHAANHAAKRFRRWLAGFHTVQTVKRKVRGTG